MRYPTIAPRFANTAASARNNMEMWLGARPKELKIPISRLRS